MRVCTVGGRIKRTKTHILSGECLSHFWLNCNERWVPIAHHCQVVTTDVLLKFDSAPSSSSQEDLPAHGLQDSFGPVISSLMHTYNTAPPMDELARAQHELNQVKDIMVQNVEQILSRGERIELLVDKTDAMAGQATAFRRGARSVRRQMWWKNKKMLGLSVIVTLVSNPWSSICRHLLMDNGSSVPHLAARGRILRRRTKSLPEDIDIDLRP